MSKQAKNLYDVLGVMQEATEKEIQKSFRKLSKSLHPDVNDASDAHEKFQEIKEAYEILSDPDLRVRYDKQLKSGDSESPFKSESSFNDIFSAFFNTKRTNTVPIHGDNIEMTVDVTAEELLRGAPRKLRLKKNKACTDCTGKGIIGEEGPCKVCDGSGSKKKVTRTPFGTIDGVERCTECSGTGKAKHVKCTTCTGKGTIPEYENFEFNLDPTGRFGNTMIFKHMGHSGIDGGETGDLRVLVKQTENDRVRVTFGIDLTEMKRIPLTKVLDGSPYLLVFPDGSTEEIELSEKMNAGNILVFPEKGLMDEKGNRGFYNLEVIVEYPELTRLQRNKILATLGEF